MTSDPQPYFKSHKSVDNKPHKVWARFYHTRSNWLSLAEVVNFSDTRVLSCCVIFCVSKEVVISLVVCHNIQIMFLWQDVCVEFCYFDLFSSAKISLR